MKKAAVIGMGDISGIHIRSILDNPAAKLAAVCDIDESKKDQAPEKVAFYTDYREMIIREKPDVVHICLPHHLHVPVSMDVAEMGAHVLCEKPVALHAKEAEVFADFEAGHPDRHIGICLQNRYNESVVMLKDIIGSGRYGSVRGTKGIVPWSRTKEYYNSKPWRGIWKTAGGGCMINQSVHTLDLLYVLGGPIAGVKASVSRLLDYDLEVEDTVAARLTYESGAHGLFMATNANYRNENVQISVQLDEAEFAIIDNVLYHTDKVGAKTRLAEDGKLAGTPFYYGAGHGKLIHKFYDALEEGSQAYIHVKDALMSIRLIDTILESGRAGSYITLEEGV